MFANLSLFDGCIVLLYLAIVLAIGFYHSRGNSNVQGFINANRSMPWPAVLGSIVATEVSAATFLATPGVGFGENMNYLQFGIGSLLARLLIAFVFVGAFYALNSLTIYDYLSKRFGGGTRYTATAFFIVTRLLASAVRLMIAVTGISLILNAPFWICLSVFTLVAIIYSGSGGIKGIIWTDVLQAVIFISCGIVLVGYVGYSIGWSAIMEIGAEHGRFEVFRFEPESVGTWGWLNESKFFWIAVMFGFLSTAAAFGTDQDMTQRILTCQDVKAARRSVILSGFISIPIAALFLFVGIALFAYYQVHGDATLPANLLADGSREVIADKVFPHFIASELPSGLRGLLLVGVFLLGIVTKRGSDHGNWIAMITAALICVTLLTLIKLEYLQLGWSWLILIGTVWTFGFGALKKWCPEFNITEELGKEYLQTGSTNSGLFFFAAFLITTALAAAGLGLFVAGLSFHVAALFLFAALAVVATAGFTLFSARRTLFVAGLAVLGARRLHVAFFVAAAFAAA